MNGLNVSAGNVILSLFQHIIMRSFLVISLMLSIGSIACGQNKNSMDFEKYDPVSTLVVPEHKLTKSRFPFIDVHNHQWNMGTQDLSGLITDMNKMNMAVMVNLSGGNGSDLLKKIQNVKSHYPNRFIVFANIDFDGLGEAGWEAKAVKQLEEDVRHGANGLKIFKDLGFSVKDNMGKRVPVDDPRLDLIWDKCHELKIPVLIHSADPKPFWDPMDEHNERWLELATHAGRKRSNTDPAPWEQIIQEQHRMFRKHPQTTFIDAHFGWYANDLARLSLLMDSLQNIYVEFGAIIAEIGRQPRMAKKFFEKYQDRILFGKDSWVPDEYATYFRVLETEDEYFPYHKKYHAFWRMYGMGLPDSILKKIYYKNALKIVPHIDASLFPN
jgi:predicted TIM-barrel fold metal-dependent hydrolase